MNRNHKTNQSDGGDAERRIESLGALDLGLDLQLMVVCLSVVCLSVVVTGGSRPGCSWDRTCIPTSSERGGTFGGSPNRLMQRSVC